MDSGLEASASSSSTSSAAAADDPSCCPICLDPLKDDAYLDRCFHSFCFKCITKWVKFAAAAAAAAEHARPMPSIRCPLCKTENLSIIHGFIGGSFQRHYVNRDRRKRSLSSAHEFRLRVYDREGEIANNIFDVQRYWKSRKYLQKNIWLQNWLRREIQTLTQEEDADVIVYHIQGVVESFVTRQQKEGLKGTPEQKHEEFRQSLFDAAGPFLLGRTERFVNELELFLASGLNVDAYDKVVYTQRLSTAS